MLGTTTGTAAVLKVDAVNENTEQQHAARPFSIVYDAEQANSSSIAGRDLEGRIKGQFAKMNFHQYQDLEVSSSESVSLSLSTSSSSASFNCSSTCCPVLNGE